MNSLRTSRPTRAAAASGLLLFLAVLACGCGESRLPTAPVTGKVLYNGEPLQFGLVMTRPDVGPLARGTIQPDGSFSLSSYESDDGAVLGTHRVRVTCFENQRPGAVPPPADTEATLGRSWIPPRYANFHSSGLTLDVQPHNEPLVLELGD